MHIHRGTSQSWYCIQIHNNSENTCTFVGKHFFDIAMLYFDLISRQRGLILNNDVQTLHISHNMQTWGMAVCPNTREMHIKVETLSTSRYILENVVISVLAHEINALRSIRLIVISHVRGPSELGLTRSISWLLMPWLLASPGHQQPWYWLCRIARSLSYSRRNINYLCLIGVEEWQKM